MAVNIIRYERDGREAWGVVRGERVVPLAGSFASTGDFIRAADPDALAELKGEGQRLDAVRILSPVTRDQRFVCQGANYRQHMIESGMNPDAKAFNMIFTKASSCIVSADSEVVRPKATRLLDYEIELGIVIKSEIDRPVAVTSENLHEYVAGVVIVNDVTARDVQLTQMQFHKGKSFRTFGPVGPYLCLLQASEMNILDDLQLTLKVNGEVRQDDNTRDLVFKPAETLTELSGVFDLSPGDLLSTGTPAGCALSVPSPAKQRIAALLPEKKKWELFYKIQSKRHQYLKPGDVIESRIRSGDGTVDLGLQRNTVVQG